MDMQVEDVEATENLDGSQRRLANLRPWKRGEGSPNPGGRPKSNPIVKKLAYENSPAAMQRIIELMNDEDPRVALMAAKEVLDRALGKPKTVEDDEDLGKRAGVTINIVRLNDDRDRPAVPVETPAVSVRTVALSGDGR